MKKPDKTTPLLIGFLIFLFISGLAVVCYLAAMDYKENVNKQVKANLEYIYSNAKTVSQVEGTLTGPGNEGNLNKSISDLTGLTVYNEKKENEYSVSKVNGEIKAFYGKGDSEVEYPKTPMSEAPINKEDLENEDLFSYYIQNGTATVTGFSESGLKFITTNSVVKIPSSYKKTPVTKIADSAFYSKNIMGKVIIPESIRTVGQNSFSMNGKKGNSNNISKPYSGTWIVQGKKWVSVK